MGIIGLKFQDKEIEDWEEVGFEDFLDVLMGVPNKKLKFPAVIKVYEDYSYKFWAVLRKVDIALMIQRPGRNDIEPWVFNPAKNVIEKAVMKEDDDG